MPHKCELGAHSTTIKTAENLRTWVQFEQEHMTFGIIFTKERRKGNCGVSSVKWDFYLPLYVLKQYFLGF